MASSFLNRDSRLIYLTPRQRAAYDELWRLTRNGETTWTGLLKVEGRIANEVYADIRGLRMGRVISWVREPNNLLKFRVLVTPSGIGDRPAPAARGQGTKLLEGEPIDDTPPRRPGRPPNIPRGGREMGSNGVYLDDGRFLAAVRSSLQRAAG